jgi:hypothetical protein
MPRLRSALSMKSRGVNPVARISASRAALALLGVPGYVYLFLLTRQVAAFYLVSSLENPAVETSRAVVANTGL